MHRLRCVVVIGVLTVAASTVAAGPVVAAKGGNSDNAHACQQGGHENRFEAETGNPFKNAGDCASHGAKGRTSAFLDISLDRVGSDSPYDCAADSIGCWGFLDADGLAGGASWQVENSATHAVLAFGTANSAGMVNGVMLNLPCSVFIVEVSPTTSRGAPIHLVVDQEVC
jgi:hypothetical protein